MRAVELIDDGPRNECAAVDAALRWREGRRSRVERCMHRSGDIPEAHLGISAERRADVELGLGFTNAVARDALRFAEQIGAAALVPCAGGDEPWPARLRGLVPLRHQATRSTGLHIGAPFAAEAV